MELLDVVPLRAKAPALSEPLGGSEVGGVLGEKLDPWKKNWGKVHTPDRNRLRLTVHAPNMVAIIGIYASTKNGVLTVTPRAMGGAAAADYTGGRPHRAVLDVGTRALPACGEGALTQSPLSRERVGTSLENVMVMDEGVTRRRGIYCVTVFLKHRRAGACDPFGAQQPPRRRRNKPPAQPCAIGS